MKTGSISDVKREERMDNENVLNVKYCVREADRNET